MFNFNFLDHFELLLCGFTRFGAFALTASNVLTKIKKFFFLKVISLCVVSSSVTGDECGWDLQLSARKALVNHFC